MARTSTIVIVGAARGIGRATALLFAERGYDVALLATQERATEQLAKQLRQMGRRVVAIAVDATDVAALRRSIRQCLLELGAIDVLANCSGLYMGGSAERSDLEDWQRVLDVNFWSCANAIHCLLPYFVGRGRGAIVNVGSFGGQVPLPRMAAYCASRYAVMGLTESLRVELAPKGVRVGLVHPGLQRVEDWSAPSSVSAAASQDLADRPTASWLGRPEEVAEGIWQIVAEERSEVVLGPDQPVPEEAYHLLPVLLQRTAQHPEWFSEEG
ncbi:MAG: SDR family oxidoreductase [Cyanobacteria bacterium]|nr:SDR family oxidoreductase [Cyanobacteriota bacterium]